MSIDEKGEHSLTKYRTSIIKADHNMLSLEVDLRFHNEKDHDRVQMFNTRNKLCQQEFKEFTSKNNCLSKCFITDETLETQFKKWQKNFQKALHSCFRKIRVTNGGKKMSKIDLLMKEKKDILKKKKLNEVDKKTIDKIDEHLQEACEDREWEKLVKVLGSLETESGATNNTNVWKEFRKAFPN